MRYSGERFLPEECKGEIAIEHYQRYQLACQMAEGKIILDAACGEGYGSSLLAQYAEKVVGLDIDKESIENAARKYENEKLSFVIGSIAKLPYEDAAFDMVVSYETIEHVGQDIQQSFLREIQRVLKPDGLLVISTPNKAVYTDKVSGHNQFHIKEFYINEYIDFLHQYFRVVETFCQFPDVGYFISRESETVSAVHNGCTREECRYIIAVCSNQDIELNICSNTLQYFDNGMYYTLYSEVHRLEKSLIKMKETADSFQTRQEESIAKQKVYIAKLDDDIKEQKKYISHLEKDISEQKEYITHLERDTTEQKEYIASLETQKVAYSNEIFRCTEETASMMNNIKRLEQDILVQKDYIVHLERDIKLNHEALSNLDDERTEQKKYIHHLEQDIDEQKKYVQHLERDLNEQAEYIRHLEKDIKILKESSTKDRRQK